jgi:hypothetical protein
LYYNEPNLGRERTEIALFSRVSNEHGQAVTLKSGMQIFGLGLAESPKAVKIPVGNSIRLQPFDGILSKISPRKLTSREPGLRLA